MFCSPEQCIIQGPVVETSFNNKVISVNGQENLSELGLGIYCNDGSFPFSSARARFANIISHRVNCEYCKCGDVPQHQGLGLKVFLL